MKYLHIADGLQLPPSAATQKLSWLGTTGSGKTYGASKLAEQFWHDGAQIVVVDPVGVWYGLRLGKDGKKPSAIDIPIFGGLHGDIPLEPTGGALIADLIVDKNISIILDVSQFESDAQKARFAGDFADRFFFRKKASPSAVHLFIEECQEFVPQNPQRGEEKMLHAFVRMQKLGRNFGIGSSYITQRPQEVNKKALNMAQTLFVFRTTGTHERKAIEQWIQDKSLDQDIAQDLPKLPTGTCHVWSPEFLKLSETVQIDTKETFNASATPEVGKKAQAVRLADIDLDSLKGQMAATIEKAKSDDPKLLRKRIMELEREKNDAKNKPVLVSGKTSLEKRIEVPVLKDSQITRLEKVFGKMIAEAERHGSAMALLWGNFNEVGDAMIKALECIGNSQKTPVTPPVKAVAQIPATAVPIRPVAELVPGDISKPQQDILDALAWLASAQIYAAERSQLAALVQKSPRSSGYDRNLTILKSMGLIDYPQPGTVCLSEAGVSKSRKPVGDLSGVDMQERAKRVVSAPQADILTALIAVHPESLERTVLADAVGKSPTSSGFDRNLTQLRAARFIDYPSSGLVRAADLFFI